jgi:PAS domain S-box-containing protein
MLRLQTNWSRYGLAMAVSVVAAILYFLSATPNGDSEVRYFGFILAILVSALAAGLGPGLLATAISALASAYLLLPPVFSIQIGSEERTARLILFAAEGVLLSFIGSIAGDAVTADSDASWMRRYAPAFLFVAAATGLKLLAYRDLEVTVPFTLFYAATAASAWAGGFGPGVVATLLSALSARYFFIEPKYALSIQAPSAAVRVALFLIEGAVLAALSGKYARARRIAHDAIDLAADYSRRMRRSVEDLRALRLTTHDVIWEWNPDTDKMIEGATESERPEETEPSLTLSTWLQQIHPEDRKAVEAGLMAALGGGSDEWVCEYRKLCPGGRSAYIADHAHIVRAPSGKAARLIGRRTDVSETKRATKIFGSVKRYRAAFEQSPLAILLADHGLRIVNANHAAAVIFGYGFSELTNLSLDRLFDPSRREPVMQALLNLNPTNHRAMVIEAECVQAGGSRFRAKVNAAMIADMGDGSRGWVVTIEDIATASGMKQLVRTDAGDA